MATDLAISMSPSVVTTLLPGGQETITISISNQGDVAASGVLVVTVRPYVSSSPLSLSSGTCGAEIAGCDNASFAFCSNFPPVAPGNTYSCSLILSQRPLGMAAPGQYGLDGLIRVDLDSVPGNDNATVQVLMGQAVQLPVLDHWLPVGIMVLSIVLLFRIRRFF